jgi:hypothetical protein
MIFSDVRIREFSNKIVHSLFFDDSSQQETQFWFLYVLIEFFVGVGV